MAEERRGSGNRRAAERRGPVPEIDLKKPIPEGAAPLKLAPDGTPTEIAGISISPKMARLIQIMRREKEHGE